MITSSQLCRVRTGYYTAGQKAYFYEKTLDFCDSNSREKLKKLEIV